MQASAPIAKLCSIAFWGAQKGVQRACDDRSDGQTAASRLHPQPTRGGRRELEGDGHRRFGNLDRLVEPCGFLQVPICLTQGQVELARETLRGFGQLRVALE